jgi:hypothetical protein
MTGRFTFDAAKAFRDTHPVAEVAPENPVADIASLTRGGGPTVADVASAQAHNLPKKRVAYTHKGPLPATFRYTYAAELELVRGRIHGVADVASAHAAHYAAELELLLDRIQRASESATVPLKRVEHFLIDAKGFLDIWGGRAHGLGWTSEELFGLDPFAPMCRYDRMGLCWFLQGGEHVTELTTAAAKLSGGLVFYRRAQPGRTA